MQNTKSIPQVLFKTMMIKKNTNNDRNTDHGMNNKYSSNNTNAN